jgi:hypothetical protein
VLLRPTRGRAFRTDPCRYGASVTAIILAIAMAFAFALTNGFHVAANAIATLVATRAARPFPAVTRAAVYNLLGPLLLGAAVANTIEKIGRGPVLPLRNHYTRSPRPWVLASRPAPIRDTRACTGSRPTRRSTVTTLIRLPLSSLGEGPTSTMSKH